MKKLTCGWRTSRPILFLVLGVLNTVLVRPEDIGSLKHALGFFLLSAGLIEVAWRASQWLGRHRDRRHTGKKRVSEN